MDFARKQLMKYGWKEGKGLGRNESGITEALKPKLKSDTQGLGHDASEQFTHHWWEHAFNKAANNIQVSTTKDGVAVKLRDESIDITTKKHTVKALKKKNPLEYGTFLKTSMLTQGGQVVRVAEDTLEIPKLNSPQATCESLTDDDLFRICGGRTAHKGARHGLKLNGKLARIEEQERLMLAHIKEDKKKALKQIKVNLKDEDDISSSQIESVGIQKHLLQLEKSGKEIQKMWKKSKSKIIPHKEDAAETTGIQTSELQSELLYPDNNTAHSERVGESKKVDCNSATTARTQKHEPTNQTHLHAEECVVFKKKKRLKKRRSETEDHELCEELENVNQEYQNIDSLSSGGRERKTKQKGILLKGTTYTKGTLMIDMDQGDYFGKCKMKKKKSLDV